MKNLALALVLSVVTMGAVSAQDSKTKIRKDGTEVKIKKDGEHRGKGKKEPKTPAERAERQSSRMTEELGLNNDQAARIKEINLRKAEQMAAVKEQAGDDKKAMAPKMKEIRTNWQAELKRVLTKEQYAKFEVKQAEKKAKMKEKHAAHKAKKAVK